MLNLEQQTVLDSHRVLIEQWEQDETKLVHTNAIADIMTLIENKKCILIKGNPGSGRSFTIRHIALRLRDRMCKQEYEIVMCRESKDIETYFKAEAYQVFVFDDICGEYTIDRREANKWSTPLTRAYITNILNRGKSKLLVSVKNQVFKESLFSELNYLEFALIDMSDEKVVTLDQKFTIAKQLLSINIKANSSVINELEDCRRNKIIRNIEFAPLIFTLDYCNEIIPVIFTDPIETYYKELHALRNVEDQSKICALFLMIVHNGNISANFFSAIETPTERNQRQCIFEVFMIPSNISRLSIEEHLRSLEGWLVVNERGAFSPKYPTIFDFLCYFFGDDTQKMQKVFIRHAHSQVLTRRTTFQSIQIDEIPRFTVSITPENEQIYFERMVDDICLGRIWDTLSNNQLHTSLSFRLRFVKHLRDLLKDKRCDLMKSTDRSDPCILVSTLYVAVFFGFMPIVEYLIQISSAQLQDIHDNFPPLIAACEKGHTDIVNLILDYQSDLNQIDYFGRRPLIVAVQYNHPYVVEMLINKNADINLGDRNGWTPLMWACVLHRKKIVELLMEHSADVNQAGNDGSTPLFLCAIMGFKKLVILLHEAEGSLSTPNRDGKTPLMAACRFQRREIVAYLLQHLDTVDEADNKGWTALMEACFKNDTGSWDRFFDQFINDRFFLPLLKLVIEKPDTDGDTLKYDPVIEQIRSKANIDMQDNEGKSALHHACEGQYNHIVNILTEMGANVNLEDKNKSTPVMLACSMEDDDTVLPLMETSDGSCKPIIEQLLSKGADINSNDDSGWNPFCHSCETGNSNMVKRLIEFKHNVNQIYHNGKTPLQMAKKSGNNEIISLLVDKGAMQTEDTLEIESHDNGFEIMSSDESIYDSSDSETETLTDAKKDTGRSLLRACRNIDEDMFTLVLEKAESENILNISDTNGTTPLLEACRYENIRNIKLLLEAGASVNKEDMKGWTPLLETCKGGDIEIVQLILERKVKINKSDDRGYSPLFIASTNGYTDIVELLLIYQADVNIANNAGITPLIAACTKEYVDVVQLLINNGANINKTDAYGNTSLMVAGFYGYRQISQALLSEGAYIDQKDSKGWTALSWATKGGHENVFLRRHTVLQ
ncbi:ankyrin repeat domain-containing protein 50-like [Mytilus edulis]|uniref:ankyrin repeat domain-containing protein 50-like n=1 Tax=Mytilus edulis TaxID=6550 RepID=UPI0039F11B83